MSERSVRTDQIRSRDLFKQIFSFDLKCLNRSDQVHTFVQKVPLIFSDTSSDLFWSVRTDLSLIWSSSGSEICYTPSYNFHRNVFIEVNFDDKICRSDHFDDSFYRSCNFDDLSYRSYNFDDPSCRSSNFDGKICRSFNFDKIFVEVITSIKVVTSIRHNYIKDFC